MARWISIFPLHGTGRFVVLTDVSQELSFQIRDGSEYASRDDVALDLAEPQLDLIQPRRVGRSEVQVNLGMHRQEVRDRPALVSREVVGAHHDGYWHFLHADGPRPPGWRAHSRAESGTGRSQAPRRTIGSGPRRPRLRSETRLHTQCRGTGFREPVPKHHGAVQYLPRNRKLPVLPRRSAHSRARLPYLPEAKRDHKPRSRTAYCQAM